MLSSIKAAIVIKYMNELPISSHNLWMSCLCQSTSCQWLYSVVNIAMKNTFRNTVICTLHDFYSSRKLDLFIRAMLLARSHSCSE